ncbi:MAG: S8 family serine peptidase [Pirellulaceae bacterium]|nr:S8 family serine peptidase [Pirellulaceae bacterium]
MPARIFAQASPRSIGGVSMFDAMGSINANTVASFQSEPRAIEEAVNRLRGAGFEILQVTAMTINIAGSQATYEKAFRTKLVIEQRKVIKPGAVVDMAEFIECPDTQLPGLIATTGTPFEDVLEGVAIEEPRYFMAASMFPPSVPYWHLDVPADVSLGINADKVHRSGITGSGIRVSMVDSGQYAHPFFAGRGYRVAPVVLGPGAANPAQDEVGHGTGESANIFAVAPDVELLPVKIDFRNSVGGFNAAVALNPNIITCSWGSSRRDPMEPSPPVGEGGPLSAADQALAAAVAAAWAAGIVVIFSAGNGQWGFPAQHPDCIAAGGVFMAIDGSLRASDYASGFMSKYYQGRRVPDACGLVGMKPKAIYIMLPIDPGCQIDTAYGGGAFPNGDQTGTNDGWGCFSGTSAAAPQLAGLAALIKQACPRLTPSDVRDIMRKTARDVTTGSCHSHTGGNPATPGPDLATGDGLVDAHKAVLLAKVRCLGPIRGVRRGPAPEPIRTVTPREPGPIEPRPVPPQPRPEPAPIRPPRPAGVAGQSLEAVSLQAQAVPEAEPVPLSQDDLHTLEDMVVKSEIKIE